MSDYQKNIYRGLSDLANQNENIKYSGDSICFTVNEIDLVYRDGKYYNAEGKEIPTDAGGFVLEKELGTTPSAAKPLANKGSGSKYDDNKEPLAYLSRIWLLGVAKVLAFGAKKYAAHNWRNGHERSRLISAALRHILAYNEGEDLDPESGLNHLDHASCCIMFAREGHDRHTELDDRWKGKKR